MSIDYEAVLIYGYKIPAHVIQEIEEKQGCFIEELCDKYDGCESDYRLIAANLWSKYDDYYFGIVLGNELTIDDIDALCWHELETDNLHSEFIEVFGSIAIAEHPTARLYHFLGVY